MFRKLANTLSVKTCNPRMDMLTCLFLCIVFMLTNMSIYSLFSCELKTTVGDFIFKSGIILPTVDLLLNTKHFEVIWIATNLRSM